MANEEHLKILKQGVEAWNEWRTANLEVAPDLSGTNLSWTYLGGANFGGVNLREANLYQAKLRKANLSEAKLDRAQLRVANLREANLIWASFGDADLTQADLSEARLFRTELTGADFSEATIGYTTFADVDLSVVKGIDTIRHSGPSEVGIHTIYQSKGKISPQFLRGAGVPDSFIDYMSSLVGTAFEFYSCFISYSGKDQEFADRLFADLQREGVRCWFSPQHVQAGKKLHEQIDVAIRLHERLLLILSPESINSEWVKNEIAKASKREIQEGKRVLFPIRLNLPFTKLGDWSFFDPFIGKDLAREIAEYYIPDFTRWKNHDQYLEEFKKLLRDLRKEDASAAGA